MNKLCAKTSPYLRADQPPLRLRDTRITVNHPFFLLYCYSQFRSRYSFQSIETTRIRNVECRIVEFSLNRSNRGNWKKRNDHKIFSILFSNRNFTLVVRTVSRNISQIVPDKGEQEEKGRRTFVRFPSSREIAESFGQRCNETRGD